MPLFSYTFCKAITLFSHVQIIAFSIHDKLICSHSLFRMIIDNAKLYTIHCKYVYLSKPIKTNQWTKNK